MTQPIPAEVFNVVAEKRAWVNRRCLPQPIATFEMPLLLTGAGRMIGSPDCTPGYYNNEGREPGPAAKLNVGHPAGPMACFKYIDAWRSSGQFEGLQFR